MVILHAPLYQAQPSRDGVRSSTAVAMSFSRKLIVIAGTEYAGEIKKSIFTVMNWKLPAEGVLPIALQREHEREGRGRPVLRPVRHGEDDALIRYRAPFDRR